MPKPKNLRKSEFEPFDLWLIRVCLVVALGISAFLAWNSFKGGGVPGCGPDSGCDKVLSSRWGYVFGLPVSVLAVPVYALLLGMVRSGKTRWAITVPLTFLILISAFWFVGIQAFVLRAFCKFCMVAHTAGIIAALVALRKVPLPFNRLLTSFGMAGAAAALLVVAQFTAEERGATQIVSTTRAPSLPPPQTAQPTNAPPPVFTILDGQLTLDLRRVPVIGSMYAPKKFAKLFDYTCHHCRELHHLLHDFRQRHSNELAIVSLPLPLDSSCNPTIKRTASAHQGACEYAKVGLAVFQANPEKYEEYTDWIFSPERPPELQVAREYAAKLVGHANLQQTLTNPAVADQIKMAIGIYMATYRKTQNGRIPQMHFERSSSLGAVANREELERIMAQNLGFPTSAK